MAGKKKKPITFTVMLPTADGYKPYEQVSDEAKKEYWDNKLPDVSTALSLMCGRE